MPAVEQFESENQALAQELDSHADAARQLEQQLEEISQMVTFFATKVRYIPRVPRRNLHLAHQLVSWLSSCRCKNRMGK